MLRMRRLTAIADATGPIIEVRDLTAGYGDRVVVHDVSFSVPQGQIVCLIGGSGCGKSTVIRAIAGLLRPFSGDVRVFGQNPYSLGELEQMQVLSRIGMLFQNGALLGSMTVGQNVGLALAEHTDLPAGVIRRVVANKLETVGLRGAAGLMPAELSGGMRKRASLSRAIALDPDLLLCDEPSAGLDPIVAAGLDATLRRLQSELAMTMLVVTHELASIHMIADRVLMLGRSGHLIADGSPAELQTSPIAEVSEFFARRPPPEHLAAGETLLTALEEG